MYERIVAASRVHESKIKSAVSLLVINGLIYVETMSRGIGEYGVANSYRVRGIEPRHHAGTTGRDVLEAMYHASAPRETDIF